MESITLETKKQLDTYMSPQRQRLLRELRLAGCALTPKQLAGKLGISPSAVQHHIKKLEELGVVALQSTAKINGITARYYVAKDVWVRFGAYGEGALMDEKQAMLGRLFQQVQQGFNETAARAAKAGIADAKAVGDSQSGVVYLSPEDGQKLLAQITRFVEQHGQKQPGQTAWEYALTLYNTEALLEPEA